jgi:hypothetical protein
MKILKYFYNEIFWGEVHGFTIKTLCEPAPERSKFDEYVDFELVEANFEKRL